MLVDKNSHDFFYSLSKKPRLHFSNVRGTPYESIVNSVSQQIQSQNLRQIVFHIVNKMSEIPKCFCGNHVNWERTRYLQYCSASCSLEATKQDRANTTLEKYGVDNFAKSTEFKTKSKKTFLKNYGVDNPSKSKEIQEKKIKTNLNKYGVLNFSQAHLRKDTYEIITDKDKFFEFSKNKTISDVAKDLGLSESGPIKIAERFGIQDAFLSTTRSAYENMIETLLNSIGVVHIKNTKKIIPPLQLDFYVPEKQLAIEVGSMYFHCERSSNRGKNYHHQKWAECQAKGITLLQYFDDDLLQKWPIVESKIKRLCQIPLPVIGARKTNIKINEISPRIERDFLTRFHLQGPNTCRTHVSSAHVGEKIVAILSIKVKGLNAEIVRYAVENTNSYPGLFSKMLKHFLISTKFAGTIYSFSDNRHSNGNLYQQSGFQLEKVTPPGYCYTKNYLEKTNRLQFQKHKLISKFKLLPEYHSLSEWQIMQSLGYDRLWDAGQSKWRLIISN